MISLNFCDPPSVFIENFFSFFFMLPSKFSWDFHEKFLESLLQYFLEFPSNFYSWFFFYKSTRQLAFSTKPTWKANIFLVPNQLNNSSEHCATKKTRMLTILPSLNSLIRNCSSSCFFWKRCDNKANLIVPSARILNKIFSYFCLVYYAWRRREREGKKGSEH